MAGGGDGVRRALDHVAVLPALPPNQEDHVELNQLLRRVMALPEDQRAALVLVSVEGFTYREAAETLSVPEGTILSRVSRARAVLREASGDAFPKLRSVK